LEVFDVNGLLADRLAVTDPMSCLPECFYQSKGAGGFSNVLVRGCYVKTFRHAVSIDSAKSNLFQKLEGLELFELTDV
jgi:hypothetical protein